MQRDWRAGTDDPQFEREIGHRLQFVVTARHCPAIQLNGRDRCLIGGETERVPTLERDADNV